MSDPLLPILIQPVVAGSEPATENLVTYALLTLLKLQARYSGKTLAQVQADFKAQWNTDYPDQPLT
jgi:hypothetical protein